MPFVSNVFPSVSIEAASASSNCALFALFWARPDLPASLPLSHRSHARYKFAANVIPPKDTTRFIFSSAIPHERPMKRTLVIAGFSRRLALLMAGLQNLLFSCRDNNAACLFIAELL